MTLEQEFWNYLLELSLVVQLSFQKNYYLLSSYSTAIAIATDTSIMIFDKDSLVYPRITIQLLGKKILLKLLDNNSIGILMISNILYIYIIIIK